MMKWNLLKKSNPERERRMMEDVLVTFVRNVLFIQIYLRSLLATFLDLGVFVWRQEL